MERMSGFKRRGRVERMDKGEDMIRGIMEYMR